MVLRSVSVVHKIEKYTCSIDVSMIFYDMLRVEFRSLRYGEKR